MIEVLNPSGVRSEIALNRSGPLPSLRGRVVGLLDNNKSNSAEFLQAVGAALQALHGVREVVYVRKRGAASPAPAELWERLKGCDLLITGFAD